MTEDQTKRSRLIQLIRSLSYREGDFTLASGKQSTFYIDMKATTLHPEGATLIGELICELIEKKGLQIDAIGGLTLGADPIATAISIESFRRKKSPWPALIVRKGAKDHGTGKFVEGLENVKKGGRVLVLEDVVTTGGSSQDAIEKLKEAGLNPVALLTVVDREQGGREALEKQGMSFEALVTISEIQLLK